MLTLLWVKYICKAVHIQSHVSAISHAFISLSFPTQSLSRHTKIIHSVNSEDKLSAVYLEFPLLYGGITCQRLYEFHYEHHHLSRDTSILVINLQPSVTLILQLRNLETVKLCLVFGPTWNRITKVATWRSTIPVQYTGLLKMSVGVLTTCHTQYT